MAKQTDTRKRNWAFIVYPDSAPDNWQEVLAEEHIPCFISPLHDKDVNATGEPKKAHWHVIMMFDGNKSEAQAQAISDKFSGIHVEAVKNLRSYARYLCHLDNAEKAKYQPGDVISLGGVDYLEKIESAADTDSAIAEILDWCEEQGCDSFRLLSNYARNNRPDWFRVITGKRTVFLVAYLKSMKHDIDRGLKK